jgi:hypothetical protein
MERFALGLLACLVLAAFLSVMARAQTRPTGLEGQSAPSNLELPAAQIVNVGNAVLRIETATGRVSTLEGNPQNLSVQNTWKERVPPLEQETSGRLQFRLAVYGDFVAVLLVDIDRGDTWILKHRGNYSGFWEPIRLES